MKILKKIDDFINDNKYSITIKDNKINVINYIKIIEISSQKIVIENSKGITIINGKDLVVTTLLDDEILITGTTNSIELK